MFRSGTIAKSGSVHIQFIVGPAHLCCQSILGSQFGQEEEEGESRLSTSLQASKLHIIVANHDNKKWAWQLNHRPST